MNGRALSEEDIQMSERKVAVVPRAWKDDWQDLIATIRVLQTERDMYKQQKKYWRSLSDQFVDIIRDRDKTIAELVLTLEQVQADLKDIINMPPELEHPSLTLYRFDGGDMGVIKGAELRIRDALRASGVDVK